MKNVLFLTKRIQNSIGTTYFCKNSHLNFARNIFATV